MSPAKSKKNNGLGTVIIVVVIILGFFYAISGSDPLGLFTEQPASGPTTVNTTIMPKTPGAGSTANEGDWWQVYFVSPQQITDKLAQSYSIDGLPAELMNASITEKLIQHIDTATKTIHIASFETDLNDVAKALIRAKGRGVDVRWITDDDSGIAADKKPGHGQFAMLKKAGIPVKDDKRGALMHDKFWLFDGQTVWTGSTNITISGMFEQNNNTIVMNSADLTAMYESQFEDMWAGKFNAKSPSTVDQQNLSIDGTKIQVLFSPEDNAISHILPYMDGAQKNIRFLAFSYTQEQLGQAMLDAMQRGVSVSGIFEATGSDTEYSQMIPLFCAKAAVRQDGNPAFLHHKVIIVDEHIVITGSLNFTDNADESNNENVIIVDNPDIARLYTEEFDRDWAVAHDPTPEKLACKK